MVAQLPCWLFLSNEKIEERDIKTEAQYRIKIVLKYWLMIHLIK